MDIDKTRITRVCIQRGSAFRHLEQAIIINLHKEKTEDRKAQPDVQYATIGVPVYTHEELLNRLEEIIPLVKLTAAGPQHEDYDQLVLQHFIGDQLEESITIGTQAIVYDLKNHELLACNIQGRLQECELILTDLFGKLRKAPTIGIKRLAKTSKPQAQINKLHILTEMLHSEIAVIQITNYKQIEALMEMNLIDPQQYVKDILCAGKYFYLSETGRLKPAYRGKWDTAYSAEQLIQIAHNTQKGCTSELSTLAGA